MKQANAPDPTKMIPVEPGHRCERMVTLSWWFGKMGTAQCDKPAIWKSLANGRHYCNHHSMKGRFIFRDRANGEIVARFDTLEELRANQSLYPDLKPQYKTKSKLKDLILI